MLMLIRIIGVGIPVLSMLVLGIVGIANLDFTVLDYKPTFEFGLVFLAFGIIGIWMMVFRMMGRALRHKKHCEVTSYIEFATVIGLVILTVMIAYQNYTVSHLVLLLSLAGIAGGVGVITYKLEAKKPMRDGIILLGITVVIFLFVPIFPPDFGIACVSELCITPPVSLVGKLAGFY